MWWGVWLIQLPLVGLHLLEMKSKNLGKMNQTAPQIWHLWHLLSKVWLAVWPCTDLFSPSCTVERTKLSPQLADSSGHLDVSGNFKTRDMCATLIYISVSLGLLGTSIILLPLQDRTTPSFRATGKVLNKVAIRGVSCDPLARFSLSLSLSTFADCHNSILTWKLDPTLAKSPQEAYNQASSAQTINNGFAPFHRQCLERITSKWQLHVIICIDLHCMICMHIIIIYIIYKYLSPKRCQETHNYGPQESTAKPCQKKCWQCPCVKFVVEGH